MPNSNNPEAAIRALVDVFVSGWNAADGAALASVFTPDADFTAITGLRARGRDLIARGHSEVLSTIYRGTKNAATIESLYFLRPDVAVVDVKFTLRMADGSLAFGVPHSSAGMIATQNDGVWGIAVFRNMIPFARPAAGPLDQKLAPGKTA